MANLHLDLIRQALAEDGAYADVTTLSTVPIEEQTQAKYHHSPGGSNCRSGCCCCHFS